MSKRPTTDAVNEVIPSKKLKFSEIIEKIDKKLAGKKQRLEKWKAALPDAKIELATKKKYALKLRDEAEEAKTKVCAIKAEFDTFKNELLTMKSAKNRLLNPVRLSPKLYADVFQALIDHENYGFSMRIKLILKYLLIGKEALPGVIQVLRHAELDFYRVDSFRLELNPETVFVLDYNNFTEKFVGILAPYMTKVQFCEKDTEKVHRIFFEALSKDQKQTKLTIKNLKKVDEFVVESLKKLSDKNVPMKIECPTTQIVADLPPIKLDYLKICKIGEWLDFLANKTFSCEFSKLDISEAIVYSLYKWKDENISTIDYIEEITVKMDSVDEIVFEQLHTYFPNAKKLIVFCDDKDDPMDENYNAEFQELDGWWKEIKEIIEDAPQSEIVLNYNYDTYFKKEYREITAKLGGQKIDDKTLRWTSNKHKSKIINFQHELKIGVKYKYFADSTDSESEARSELFYYESDHELDWLFESDEDDWSSTDDYSDAEVE